MKKKEKLFYAALRQDLHAFAQMCWKTLYPDKKMLHNWHIEAIIHHLMMAASGQMPRLIVNMPPRHLKSFLINVVFPAWMIGQNPSLRIICISYSDELALNFTREFRQVIESEWYRKAFPQMKIGVKNTQTEITTTRNGYRLTTSTMGTLTGRGGDIIIIDDPIKGEDAQSEKKRTRVNEWFDTTLISRLDDKIRGICILVMQRLNPYDLTGHLEARGGYHKLSLPAIATKDEDVPTGSYTVHRRKEGDVLHPERESAETLELIKRQMGSINFSAQYQQEPVPPEGNLFRRSFIKTYKSLPQDSDGVYAWSWDTADSVSETADYSVGTLWFFCRQGYYLMELIRRKLEFPDLMRTVATQANRFPGCAIVIESAVSGRALHQNLARMGYKVFASRTTEDKLARAMEFSVTFEAGRVFFPEEAPWMDALLNELLAFPNVSHDDQVDSITHALKFAERKVFPVMIPGFQVDVHTFESVGRRRINYLKGFRDDW